MTTIGKAMLGVMMATLLATAYAAPSRADDPVKHHIRYIVTAASPIYADIYYLDQEPPIFSDYSHNPYQYVPNVQADIAPGKPWVSPDVMLANPDLWAMVSVSTGTEPGTPQFQCSLVVDGNVVVTKNGAKGALCSLRNW